MAKRSEAHEDTGEARGSSPRTGRVALFGRPNVGKSTLLNALVGERIAIVSHHPQTTRDRIAGIVTRGNSQLVFLDTPGLHASRNELGARMNEVATETAHGSDVVLFVVDARQRPGGELDRADVALSERLPAGTPAILVLNKVDLLEDKAALLPLLEAWGRVREFAAVVPVSARRSDGVDRILDEVQRHLPEGEWLFPADELSDKPTRFFVAEFVREQILRRTRQEVPHGVAVTVDAFEEEKRVAHVILTVHVAKESHKPIVIGKGATNLREIGTKARERVEALLGRRVHLDIRVRTSPNWFSSQSALADLGYTEGAKRAAPAAPATPSPEDGDDT